MKRITKLSFWMRRRSNLVVIGIFVAFVVVLFLNEDTSIARNMEYQREINDLKAQIKLNEDSAVYYRNMREAVLAGRDELEHLAREKFHMQRPTEDVYIIKE